MEKILRTAGHNVTVINGGVEGYTSWENLASLLFRAPEIGPDIVIVYQGYNDAAARLVPPGEYLPDNRGFSQPFRDTPREEFWRKSNLVRVCVVGSGHALSSNCVEYHHLKVPLLFLLATQVQNGSYPKGVFAQYPVHEMFMTNAPTHYQRNIEMQAAVCRQNDWTLVFATMAYGRPDSAPIVAECFIEGVRENNEVMRDVAQRGGVPLCDLEKLMPQDNVLYVDGLHATQQGASVRAQKVADFLLETMIIQ